jgi:Lon protease-like protein
LNDVRVLPMFPLGTVLFPHAVLPLHVFEPRYREMMQRCLAADGEFGVVLIERGSEVGGGDTRFDVGTLARIVQAAELPDGRYAIASVGRARIQVVRWLTDDPFPRAEVEPLPESEPDAATLRGRDGAVQAFAEVLQLWHRLDERVPIAPAPASDDAVRDVYEIAAAAPIGPLDAQRVLAASTEDRGALLEQTLRDVAGDLRARIALG